MNPFRTPSSHENARAGHLAPPGTSPDGLFQNALVDDVRANGGVYRCAGTTVLLPRVFGFCGGVLRAVNMLRRELDAAPRRTVWLLGPIIHNPTVNEWFRQRGARILPEEDVESCFRLAHPGDCLVVPAFGLPAETDRRVREFVVAGGRIVDTTCPYVERIWRFAEEQARGGRTVVIHGKPDHPETRGILSRSLSSANSAILVPDRKQADRLAEAIRTGRLDEYPRELVRQPAYLRLDDMAAVNQTTMLHSETVEIQDVLRGAVETRGGAFLASNTVCRATQERQDAARDLCRARCELRIVVGGFDSSNTNRLYALADAAGPAYFVQNADAIEPNAIRHFDPASGKMRTTTHWRPPEPCTIGLLAGASCPDGIVGNIIRALLR